MKQTFLSILLMLLPLLASAETVEINGIWYNLVNISKVKTAEVTRNPNLDLYSGSYWGDIVIPKTVTYEGLDYTVTSIGGHAFFVCHGLNSIVIPTSVTTIGYEAFWHCDHMKSITIEGSIPKFDSSAFDREIENLIIMDLIAWCNSTEANDFPYKHIYYKDNEIKDLVIPNGVTRIPVDAFARSIMSSLTIPNSVTSIEAGAFALCSNLTSIAIPNSVTSIGSSAFAGCSGLTSITIPNSVTSIGISAFSGCSGLTSIIVEEGNTIYDSRNNCNTIIETESNTLITGCKNTTIPNSVTSIGNGAFYNCSGLSSITIPNSVTSIGNGAFYNCSGLSSVTIPNSVTSIGNTAYYNCSGLSSITIPNSVTSIEFSAFSNCPELTDVTCLAENVPYTSSDAFDGSYITYATLHVPASAVDAYKSTAPWSNFKSFVAVDGSEIPETPKCATPTITYKNGKISFSCETEGVEYVSTITAGDTKSFFTGEITLTNKYTVSVYATKDGYDKSDTATLDIIGSAGAFGDLNEDGEVNVADHVELTKIIMNQSK